MKNLFGQTILRKIINTTFFKPEKNISFRRESRIEDSRTYHANESSSIVDFEQEIQEKLHASSPKLAIQTDGDKLGIIRLRKDRSVLWNRYFTCEDVTHLKTAQFYAFNGVSNLMAKGTFGKEYLQLRKTDIRNKFYWKCKIEVAEFVRLFADLASDLDQLHNKGFVHSDLKPDNILIMKKGIMAIDSMDTPVGQNSPGVTMMYAAPEQIMRETVCPQTDQYAFGVMLSELLGGVIYGEEVNYIIPTGGQNSTRMTMLKNPDVFFDPTTCAVPIKAIPCVRSLIKKCLNFKSTDRFASMNDIASEITKWTREHNFSHELECPLDFGTLKHNKKQENYWLLTDSYR